MNNLPHPTIYNGWITYLCWDKNQYKGTRISFVQSSQFLKPHDISFELYDLFEISLEPSTYYTNL